MFARRFKPTLFARIKDFVWPRIGFRRSVKYIRHRLVRLPGTPYTIAGGFACGAAVSFTPFIGFHFILGAICAWTTRSSIIASAIGTAVGNPWTFPFIWTFVYNLGTWMLGAKSDDAAPMESLSRFFQELWSLIGNGILWLGGMLQADAISTESAVETLNTVGLTVLWPMFLASIPTALVVWIIFYFPLKYLVAGYQSARRARIDEQLARNRTAFKNGDGSDAAV